MAPKRKEDVIRNPARKFAQALGKREPYQPEYIRLGIDPPKPAKVPQADFEYAFNKRKPFVTSTGGKKHNPVEPPRVAVISKSEVVESPRKRDVPRQVMVSSGFQHEHTWHPVAQYYDEETIPEDQANEEVYPWQANRSDEELEQEERDAASGRIGFDEVPDDEEERDEPEQEHTGEKKKPVNLLERVPSEGYCIAVDGQIVHVSDTLEDVEAMLEYILFDQGSPLGDVSIESISVFKKLSIRAGVVVRE